MTQDERNVVYGALGSANRQLIRIEKSLNKRMNKLDKKLKRLIKSLSDN